MYNNIDSHKSKSAMCVLAIVQVCKKTFAFCYWVTYFFLVLTYCS